MTHINIQAYGLRGRGWGGVGWGGVYLSRERVTVHVVLSNDTEKSLMTGNYETKQRQANAEQYLIPVKIHQHVSK